MVVAACSRDPAGRFGPGCADACAGAAGERVAERRGRGDQRLAARAGEAGSGLDLGAHRPGRRPGSMASASSTASSRSSSASDVPKPRTTAATSVRMTRRFAPSASASRAEARSCDHRVDAVEAPVAADDRDPAAAATRRRGARLEQAPHRAELDHLERRGEGTSAANRGRRPRRRASRAPSVASSRARGRRTGRSASSAPRTRGRPPRRRRA